MAVRIGRAAAFAGIILIAFAGSACYSYVPVDANGPSPSRTNDVRVFLATPLPVALEGITINRARRVDGEFISMTPDSLFVSAMNVVDAAGLDHAADDETIRIGRNQIDYVELRKPALARTLLAAGGVIAFGTVTSVALADGGGGGSHTGSGGQAK